MFCCLYAIANKAVWFCWICLTDICVKNEQKEQIGDNIPTPCLKKLDMPIMSRNSPQNRTVSVIFDTSNCPSTLDTLPWKLLIWQSTSCNHCHPMSSNNKTTSLWIEEIIFIKKIVIWLSFFMLIIVFILEHFGVQWCCRIGNEG